MLDVDTKARIDSSRDISVGKVPFSDFLNRKGGRPVANPLLTHPQLTPTLTFSNFSGVQGVTARGEFLGGFFE